MKSTNVHTPESAGAADDAARDDDAAEQGERAPETEAVAPDAATLDAELAAMRDRWLRTEAELQNYRRRAQRDVEEARRGAEERALIEHIEALDDLDRALDAAHAAGADAAWVQGVELVAQRMRDRLVRAGVTAVSPAGEPFDPRFHEALVVVPAAAGVAPGSVLQVERTGYRLGERVLRAARVVVAGESAGDA